MQKITSSTDLKDAILLLEERRSFQGQVLKEDFFVIVESIKPVNIIRNTFSEVVSSPDLIGSILSTTLGLTAGFLSKRTLIGASGNLFKKLFGTLLQLGVTTLFVRNPGTVKSISQNILQRFLSKKETAS
jgi:hypothetical protein